MNLYDVALAIFLKKNLPPYVTDVSVTWAVSINTLLAWPTS